MKAMILAAGLGTRLGNMTSDKPKALVKINDTCLLESLILRLKKQGVTQIAINIHHFGGQIIEFIEKHDNFGIELLISDERDNLLDTGGALLKASAFFSGTEPVLVHNVDIYSELNINKLIDYHRSRNTIATFCMRRRTFGRVLIVDHLYHLIGWANLDEPRFRWVNNPYVLFQTFAFEGIYIVNPEFVKKIPFNGKFSIIECWLEMAKTEKIAGYNDENPVWFDFGTQEKIKIAEEYFKNHEIR